MSPTNRRTFLSLAAAGAALSTGLCTAEQTAATPMAGHEMSLKEAFEKRRSTRLYDDKPVEGDMLEALMWYAFGVNRPESGGRTAPSWHASYGTDIYVAEAGGVRKFDPAGSTFIPVLSEDIRKKTSPEPFVGTAPTVLVYVADLDRMYEAPQDEQVQAAHVDAAIISQNVYLYCASAALGTCLVGGADKPALVSLLKLPETQIVTFVQPVGHLKTTK